MKQIFIILITVFLNGCVASYTHISNPRIDNDGFDLVCLEGIYKVNDFNLRGGTCKDLSGTKEEYAKIGIEYEFKLQ